MARERRYDDEDEVMGDDLDVKKPKGDYAGFGLRFVALLLDFLILFIPSAAIGFVIGLVMGVLRAPMPATQGVANVVGIVISWLYFALQESSPAQATLGKRAMNIIVTDLEGRRISFGQATGRYFGKILSGCTCFIGYLMVLFTEKQQGLHDILAGTLVVRK